MINMTTCMSPDITYNANSPYILCGHVYATPCDNMHDCTYTIPQAQACKYFSCAYVAGHMYIQLLI